jgi:hypothetical protein
MYLTNTRPDVCFFFNTLSQYMEQPMQVHLVATKHVMRYVTDHDFGLYGYSDSDWAESIPNQKSTSTYCFSLGPSMVSWSRRK